MTSDIRKSFLITGRSGADSWAKALQLLDIQTEIPAGDDFGGRDSMTKDMTMLIDLDAAAVAEIVSGVVHPAFETGEQARKKYDEEFTYYFVKNAWARDPKYQFIYDYMDRLINHPLPNTDFMYQGRPIEFNIPEEYKTTYNGVPTGGFDQLKWLHDAIRKDGISRRHQIITWIPALDDFTTSPPCLQRIWIRVLIPKSEWAKYKGAIPVEVHIEYRSWDIGRALPSNLYGLFNMLYRYVLGNLTADTEYVRIEDGVPVPAADLVSKKDVITDKNGVVTGTDKDGVITDKDGKPVTINRDCKPDFVISRAVLFGNGAYVYYSAYPLTKNIKPAGSPIYKKQ